MKVKMLETFQGRDVSALHMIDGITVSILETGEEYQVNDGLGVWLVENYKAKELPKPPQPEPKVDEIIPEIAEEQPKFDKKRGRK